MSHRCTGLQASEARGLLRYTLVQERSTMFRKIMQGRLEWKMKTDNMLTTKEIEIVQTFMKDCLYETLFVYDFIFGCFSNIVQFYKNIYERLIFTTETVYFCRSSGTLFFFRFFQKRHSLCSLDHSGRGSSWWSWWYSSIVFQVFWGVSADWPIGDVGLWLGGEGHSFYV